MKKTILSFLILPLALTAIANVADVTEVAKESQSIKYDKIKIEARPELLIKRNSKDDPEAVSLSPDGNRLAWIDKKRSSDSLQAVNMWGSVRIIGEFTKYSRIRKAGLLDLYTGISFTADNMIVASEEGYKFGAISATTAFMAFSNEDTAPKGYNSCIKVNYKRRNERKLCVKDFGLVHGDFLQHPRISPNGKYLAIYIKGSVPSNKAGLYIYLLEENRSFHVDDFPAKHPTWSPSGDKLLFHYQIGGNTKDGSSIEKAVIGYYEIISNSSNIIGRRVLMDDINQADYIYHKHPTVIPETSILIFHGQNKVDGKKKLYARKLEQGSKIFQLKILGTVDGKTMYTAKHPAASYQTKELVFIGKEKDIGVDGVKEDGGAVVKGPKQIYRLGPEAVQEIQNTINGTTI